MTTFHYYYYIKYTWRPISATKLNISSINKQTKKNFLLPPKKGGQKNFVILTRTPPYTFTYFNFTNISTQGSYSLSYTKLKRFLKHLHVKSDIFYILASHKLVQQRVKCLTHFYIRFRYSIFALCRTVDQLWPVQG